jgi:hypothetical protein
VDSKHPWPDVGPDGQWAIDTLEEFFERTTLPREQMLERARQLRREAELPEFAPFRRSHLIVAGRREEAAAARLDPPQVDVS